LDDLLAKKESDFEKKEFINNIQLWNTLGISMMEHCTTERCHCMNCSEMY
jgi:hypothetical protein